MTFEEYNKNYCIEFDFVKLGLDKYEYFINQIDKSNNSVKIIHITYDKHQLESVFDSTNFTEQLILEYIKIGLVKGLLGLLKIDYKNKNLNDLFCSKN